MVIFTLSTGNVGTFCNLSQMNSFVARQDRRHTAALNCWLTVTYFTQCMLTPSVRVPGCQKLQMMG